MREASTEGSSIDVDLSSLGHIDLLAPRAIVFESRDLECIAQADRQDLLTVAKCTRASAVDAAQKLLVDLGQPSWGKDVARMQHAVEIRGVLVQL